MTLDKLLEHIHSRHILTASTLVLLCIVGGEWLSGATQPVEGDRGLLFPSANHWFKPGVLSTTLNLLLIFFSALVAQAINKRFNVMRSITGLWGAMFLVMAGALINLTNSFNGSTILVATMLIVTWLLYSCYDNSERRRRIFLIFFLLALGGTFQYAFLLYVPVVVLGMVQMKVLNLHTIAAALLGLITPPWIIIGGGIVDPADIKMPTLIATWAADLSTDKLLTLVTLGLIALLGIGFYLGNFLKLLSYNARNRAFNGFQTLLLFSTIVLALVDYTNLALYSLLLAMESAYQIAHFFTIRRLPQSSIVILAIFALFIIFALSTILA